MPSGRVHAKCTLYLTPPCAALGAIGGFLMTHDPLQAAIYAACCAVGCLAGVPLSPDLDQESISTAEYWIVKKTWGLGFAWCAVWFPYARCTAHRGTLSHFPFIGTAGRLLYIALILAIAVYFGLKLPSVPYSYVLFGVIGLLVSDIAHWALDVKFGDPWQKKGSRRKQG